MLLQLMLQRRRLPISAVFHSSQNFEIWTYWDDNVVIRLVTSWHTSQNDVKTLCQYLELAMSRSRRNDEAVLAAEAQEETPEESL